jgi:hypothetical protein
MPRQKKDPKQKDKNPLRKVPDSLIVKRYDGLRVFAEGPDGWCVLECVGKSLRPVA